MTFNPPHKATDRKKIASLVRAMRRGDKINPIVTIGEMGITGSHRIEAARIVKAQVPYIVCDSLDYRRAAYVAQLETHDQNLNLFCSALQAVTKDAAVLSALEDQGDGDYIDPDLVSEALEMSEDELIEHRGW